MAESTLASKQATLRRKILGVKIRHARSRTGLSLNEVGQVLTISADDVTAIELGQRPISLPHLEVMAIIFNVPLMYFWSEDPIKEPDLNFPSQEAIALRQRIIGGLLRRARTEAGRSQGELANALGVPTGRLADYEFGRVEIPLQELEAATEYLNVSLGYFIDEGIPNQNGQTPTLDEIAEISQLPREVRAFLANPANLLYINIAMKLSALSADTLRALAEGLLEVTY